MPEDEAEIGEMKLRITNDEISKFHDLFFDFPCQGSNSYYSNFLSTNEMKKENVNWLKFLLDV